MTKKTSLKDKSIVKPQSVKGYVPIAGKKIAIGSIKSSKGSSPDKIIRSLQRASKKEIFPQIQTS
jgi:hypothetical protein